MEVDLEGLMVRAVWAPLGTEQVLVAFVAEWVLEPGLSLGAE